MVKKIIILCVVALLLVPLIGCNKTPTNDIQNTSTDSYSTESTQQYINEITTIYKSQDTDFDKPDSKQKIDYTIPEEFVDYRKFIGLDVSVLNANTTSWNYNDFSHDLWNGSFYGHNGTISVRLGWDNKTIIEFYLILNDDEKIKDNERDMLNKKIMSIFGSNVEEQNISYTFSGIGDFEFCIPKTLEQRSVCTVTWNSSILYNYMISKPKETTENDTTQKPLKNEPEIGMTAEEVKNSTWGKPTKINKTTTKYGVHEQWVYSSGKYIYFDDGVVTSIQE